MVLSEIVQWIVVSLVDYPNDWTRKPSPLDDGTVAYTHASGVCVTLIVYTQSIGINKIIIIDRYYRQRILAALQLCNDHKDCNDLKIISDLIGNN